MRVIPLALAVLLVGAAAGGEAMASRCRACTFAGLCREGGATVECGPKRARCVPNGGILGFNSTAPAPAYWTVFATALGRRSRGRLDGRLAVWADYTYPVPTVPGLLAQCDASDRICSGAEAEFSGTVTGDHLAAVAHYPDGATCDFTADLTFGLGRGRPNGYVCRGPTGDVVSQGGLRVQLLRVLGCRRRRSVAAPY